NAAYTAQLESFEKDQADRQSKFTGLLDKSAEELLAFKKAYNEELATRSAVSYWSSKAIMHRVLGGIAALATVIGGFLYFGIVVPNSFTNLVKHFNVGAEQPEWRAGIVVGLMLLGVWMGRIAVR